MNIELKSIRIKNFKGLTSLDIDFGQVTNIKADNAKGKTTIFDAFCWVLFGKDSHGSGKFHIRPIDAAGKDIDYIDIEVELSMLVDGFETAIKKSQKQKWTKKRGSEDKVFDGNYNEFEWNGFPKSEKEFNASIADIVTDSVFMIVTNPFFFPAQDWKKQRQTLMQLIPEITDADVYMTDTRFEEVLHPLLNGCTSDDLKAKYAKALKEWNKQIDAIPGRIDEVSRSIKEVDYSEQEQQLVSLQTSLDCVNAKIEDASKAYEVVNKLNQEIFDTKSKMQDIEYKEKQRISDTRSSVQNKIDTYSREFSSCMDTVSNLNKTIEREKVLLQSNEEYLAKTRKDFKEQDAIQFDEDSLICPTCGQDYPEDKKEGFRNRFQDHKTKELTRIRELGHDLKDSVEASKQKITSLEDEVKVAIDKKTSVFTQLNSKRKELENIPTEYDLSGNEEYSALKSKLEALEQEKNNCNGTDVTVILKQERTQIRVQIDEVKKVLNDKQHIEEAKKRVIELKKEQKDLAQKVAECEKVIFLLEEFMRAKMDLLSNAINSKFKLVNWKLFDMQINGGMKETCELTLKGVPYSDLNSAGKTQAGLDIINTLSDIYEVNAPIFIDNREGVNEIPKVDAQIINLIVIPKPIEADKEILL